ncbi:MAG: hypothetical protein IPN83_13160 [Holophagales bacterium]|nr:hypothetical protein [Holophagales bacterium]
MTAFALALGLFAFWSVVGWSVLSLLLSRRNLLRSALLAPVVGVATLILLLFELSRLGVPVRIAGPVGSGLLFAGSLAVLWFRRTPLPARRLAPLAAIVLAAAFVTGAPLLLHGFDWVSFCNEDMTNYVLAAQAFLDHGYLSAVDPRAVIENRDPGLLQWLQAFTSIGVRQGSELTLAWGMSLTGLTGHRIYMVTIVALHLSLVSVAGAVVLRRPGDRVPAVATCALVAASALTTLGTLYQLISQVLGLGLLAGASVLLFEPVSSAVGRAFRGRAAAGGLLFSALAVAYPEVLPFLGLGFLLSHALSLARGTESARDLAALVARVGLAAFVLLNLFGGSVVAFLSHQAGSGLSSTAAGYVLFPFYLVPSGLSAFWGLQPLVGGAGGLSSDLAIVAGGLLLAVAAVAAVRSAWRGEVAGTLAAVMLALALRLVVTRSDFGLYKLAMFVQPFLLGAVALGWFRVASRFPGPRRRALYWAPLVLLAAPGLSTQAAYVKASAGLPGALGGFSEIPGASRSSLVSRLSELARQPRRDVVVADTANVVLAKLVSASFAPSSLRLASRNYFEADQSDRSKPLSTWYVDALRPGYLESIATIRKARRAWFTRLSFDLLDGRRDTYFSERDPATGLPPESYTLLASGRALTVVNRRNGSLDPVLSVVPSERVRNHLVLLDSALGSSYYVAKARANGTVAMYQLEPDPLVPGTSFASVGPTLQFLVLAPSPRFRVALEYTATLAGDGVNLIPPAAAVGAVRVPFPVVGRGAFRLFSPPLEPQWIAGEPHLALDLGRAGQRFREDRTGLMRLWGTRIPMDPRRVTGFVRDVSIVTEEEYGAMEAPTGIRSFPDGLADPGLEFSGIYEDGWVGEACFLRLRQPRTSSVLVVRVMVPVIGPSAASGSLAVLVDGAVAGTSRFTPGDVEVRVPLALPDSGRIRRVELRFDRGLPLPGADRRIASALLQSIGFEDGVPGSPR